MSVHGKGFGMLFINDHIWMGPDSSSFHPFLEIATAFCSGVRFKGNGKLIEIFNRMEGGEFHPNVKDTSGCI